MAPYFSAALKAQLRYHLITKPLLATSVTVVFLSLNSGG